MSIQNTGTGAHQLPVGTESQRPTTNLSSGLTRFNDSKKILEYHNGSTWVGIGLRDGSNAAAAADSAAAIKALTGTTTNGFYWILIGSTPTQIWCDMTNDGGGWMLAAKSSGNDDAHWYYSDAAWTDTTTFSADQDAIAYNGHIKTTVFTNRAFTQVRLPMQTLSNAIIENWSGSTFASFMNGSASSGNARSVWVNWLNAAWGASGDTWLANCNQFGINKAYNYQNVRLGGTINGEGDCNTNDESFGWGLRGISPYSNNTSSGSYSPYGRPSGRRVAWIFLK